MPEPAVAEGLRDLRSPDEEVRRLAVERLPDGGMAAALDVLVECLGDPSWRVRKAAVERLVRAPEQGGTVAALVGALADGENPGRRNAALEALTRCGRVAVPALVEASFDPDVDVRKQVVDALAGIGDESAAGRLASLLGDPDANVRGAAADALGAVGDESAVEPLLRTARDDAEKLVRLSALRALARLEAPAAVADLASAFSDPLLCGAAYALLGASADPGALEVLVKGLGDPARSAREAAMEALVRLAASAEAGAAERIAARLQERRAELGAVLREGAARLGDAPLRVRMSWVQFLGLLRDPASVIPLLGAARDEALGEVVLAALANIGAAAESAIAADWDRLPVEGRAIACAVLGRSGGASGEALLRQLLEEPSPELRCAAARALGERRAAAALPDLVAALSRTSEMEAEEGDEEADLLGDAIAEAAGGAGAAPDAAARAVSLLAERVPRGDEIFRLATARIVGRIGRRGDTGLLEIMASDPSAAVRRAAVEALARLDPSCAEPLRLALADEAPLVRVGAAAALVGCGESWVLPDLLRLVADEDERVRLTALRAIGAWSARAGSDAGTRATVLEALGQGLAHGGSMAMAALDALGELGGEAAAGCARRALTAGEPELVQGAVACVGRHGSTDQLEDLSPLLAHEHWTVRAEVARVVAERRVAQVLPAIRRRLEVEQDAFVRDALLDAARRLET